MSTWWGEKERKENDQVPSSVDKGHFSIEIMVHVIKILYYRPSLKKTNPHYTPSTAPGSTDPQEIYHL